MMKKIVFASLSLLFGVLITAIFLEIALRILPVSDTLYTKSVTNEDPVFRFQENRSGIYSKSWNFRHITPFRVNNDGFVNDQNYTQVRDKPLIAVVGDSYIEALIVGYKDSFFGHLAKELNQIASVYSFGASGAPLSQYLIWAKYAKEHYNSNYLIINIVGNDFDESLLDYKNNGGFHYYKTTDDGLELQLVEYKRSSIKDIFIHSALIRYLYFHLSITSVFDRFKNSSKTYIANTDASVDEQKLTLSKMATIEFLSDLPNYAGLDPSNILLVIDGVREDIYEGRSRDSYARTMFDYTIKEASKRGFGVLDMDKPFKEDWGREHQRFEFIDDGHWNQHAHKVVYESILENQHFKTFIDGIKQ